MPDLHNFSDIVPLGKTLPPFDYPLLHTENNLYLLPTYSEIVYASREVDFDTLDALQSELELLLSASVARSQIFQKELKKCGRKRVQRKITQPGKRTCLSRVAKETHFTRFQDSPKKPKSVSPLKKKAQTEAITAAIEHGSELEPEVTPFPKRSVCKTKKTAHKYWLSVERYCRPINHFDVKFLNTLTETHRNELSRPLEIPPLGEHYSLRWASYDLMGQECTSTPSSIPLPQYGMTNSSLSTLNLLKKSQNFIKGSDFVDSRSEAPCLQTVLSKSLNRVLDVETNEQSSTENSQEPSEESLRKTAQSKSFREWRTAHDMSSTRHNGPNISSTLNKLFLDMEPRFTIPLISDDHLKSDLDKVGTIDHEKNELEDKDEIVEEIKRCHKQLNCLISNNLIQLERCAKLAQQEMRRQELRKKLRSYDSAIVEIHQKINENKLKKQPASKQDQFNGWKLLKDRELLIKKIDSLDDMQG